MLDYQEYLERRPGTVGGQTVMKGTRVPLRTVLASLAEGDSSERILGSFPTLTREHVQAAIAFAAAASLEDIPVPQAPAA